MLYSGYGLLLSLLALYFFGPSGLGLFSIYYSAVIWVRSAQSSILNNNYALLFADKHKINEEFLFLTLLLSGFVFLVTVMITLVFHTVTTMVLICWSELLISCFRSISHKNFRYLPNIFTTFLRIILVIFGLIIFGEGKDISNFFSAIAFSNLIVVLVLFLAQPVFPKIISKNDWIEDYWKQGRYLFFQGNLNFLRTYSLNYILAYFIGMQELGYYRITQLLFTPLAVLFSTYESYVPQKIARSKDRKVVKSMIDEKINWLKSRTLVIFLIYTASTGTIIFFWLPENQLKHVMILIVLFAPFQACAPYISLYAIFIRYLKLSRVLLQIYLIEFVITTSLYAVIVPSFGLYAALIVKVLMSVTVLLSMRRVAWQK